MEYKDFLSGLQPVENRQNWWERFQKAESFAQKCVGSWPFVALHRVILTPNDNCWFDDGTIKVEESSLERGSLYHELFHSVLHNAPLKKKAEKTKPAFDLYCESLCNAFEYFMEDALGPADGDVRVRIDKWKGKTWAEIVRMSGDLAYDLIYGLPAFEFVKACANFDEFKKMFFVLNEKA